MKISIVSGGFDPLHVGHIKLLNKAKKLSDGLVVILKKGKSFVKFEERKIILENLRCVDLVVGSVDTDTTVCKTLEDLASLRIKLPNGEPWEKLYFCTGGNSTDETNAPEHLVCQRFGIETVVGL